MSYLGLNKLGKIYLGTTEIAKVYLGTNLVYSSSSSNMLPYDAEIEYLQASGTQYINTGINGQSVTRFIVQGVCAPDGRNNTQLLGGTAQGAGTFFGARFTGGARWYCMANGNGLGDPTHRSTIDATIVSTSSQTGTLADLVSGTTSNFTSFSSGSWQFPNENLLLFGGYSTRRSPNARCYSLKIYTSSGLVRDFIPVRVGTTGYMYDRVNGELFGNSGSGSFTLGNDITYTALDYIKFTGSQWILTDYYPNPKTHLMIDMQFEANGNAGVGNGGNQWIGCYNNTVGNFSANFGAQGGQYGQIFYWFENPYVSAIWSGNYGNDVYNRSTFTYLNNKVTFQGINTNTETKTTTQDGYLMIGINQRFTTIFNRHNLKIFSMKIYEDNVLLHEYYPKQRNNDGVNGLYDIVTDTFITSQTETNLVGE